MVAYFCHHLSVSYVDLYVVLLDLYVDLSLIHLLENKILKTCSCPDNAIQIIKLSDKSTFSNYIDLSDHYVDLSEKYIDLSDI